MKKMVKKVLEILCVVTITLAVNGAVGMNDGKVSEVDTQLIVNDSVLFEEMVTEAVVGTELKVVGAGTTNSGNYIVDLSNGSYVAYNVAKNIVEFQPVELGDWDMSFDNMDDAMNCVSTYAINDTELATGVTISSSDWLEDDTNENSNLLGNVVIDDGKTSIEITKDVYNTIEHGENSELDGDVYIDDSDILSSIEYK